MRDINHSAGIWLAELERALKGRNNDLFESLFAENAMWRDLLSFTFNIRQFHDRDAIANYFWTTADELEPSNFTIDANFPVEPVSEVPFSLTETFEIDFTFETTAGFSDGLVHVVPDPTSPGGLRAVLLLTRLQSLRDLPPVWPKFGRYNQLELENERKVLEQRKTYSQGEPEVLIVGAGHNGVFVAAALARLGIDALIVDKHERAGDSWRKRYDSLVLHMPHGMMQFLHLPFPDSFPDYISKDRLADWYEVYVNALDLNLWTSTEFVHGEYDEDAQQWSATVRQADGTDRTFRPKYLVLATGGSGTPRIPDLPGLQDFTGPVTHSHSFRSGADFAGKNVLVVGTGTSAHDIAFDIVNHDGKSTLLQRGATFVVDLPSANLNYGPFNTRSVPTDVVDKRWLVTQIKPLMLENFKRVTAMGNELDKELHEQVEKAGLVLDKSEYGFFAKYFEVAGGYYINVGASQAMIRGDIKVEQFSNVDRFVGDGIRLNSGEVRKFDAIVLATGYENQRVILERFFGSEVAERIGDVAGYDAGGDPERNQYKPIAAQPRLAIAGSGISAGRWYAPLVALEIQAEFEGRIPESFKAAGHPSQIPTEALTTS
ncbi:NAD(P)/FAD-dependent oxidoreductase [Arthrobacter sp. D1-29]